MSPRVTAVLALLMPALAFGQYDPNRPPPPYRGHQTYYQGPPETGLVLGARIGYGTPIGPISHEGDPRLDDAIDSKIPIWLDLGYRFNRTVWGGVYFEFAPVNVSSNFCIPGRSCDGSSFRVGVDMQFHLAPYRPIDPWVGIGAGAEFLSFDAFDATVNDISTFHYSGFEFPLLEAGLDLALSPNFTLGPYVSYSAGEFTDFGVDTPGFASLSGSINDRAYHGWFQIGVKGTFKL